MREDLSHPSAGAPERSGRAQPALVRLRNISKNFGAVEAVKPLDLDIHRGDFFAILGPSGCGKTTLLRMIGGFIAPTSGSVEIGGTEVTKLGPEMRPTNMVFQGLGLFPHMTVRQNIAYGLRIARQPRADIAERVREALNECYEAGILGEGIFGTDYKLDIILRRGAGAYICGEETALFNSLEGKRGNPRFKPPFPTNSGVWSKPTAINNIETFACVAPILEHGAEWFKGLAVGDGNAGTKVYCLSGNVHRTGLFELPLGTTARELIFDCGGGVADGRTLKAFKPGGASAAVLTPDLLDVRLDPSIMQHNTIMGTGGCIVLDDTVSIVESAYRDALFFEEESCGFCIPCRQGTPNLVQILERILHGEGSMADLDLLESIGESMASSFCGLGQFAYRPAVGALHRFRDEFEGYIRGELPVSA